MVEVLVHFVAPALVGVLIGIASGLLGIGGGTVMVPIFRLAFGMSATMSTATSLFAIIPTSISGAISHVPRASEVRVCRQWGCGSRSFPPTGS